jgi:MFS transporter, DHA3 family, macrolide efflux protein
MILGVRTDSRGGRKPARPSTAVKVVHLGRTVRGSPCYPALSHPVLRRVLPSAAASALGDGMSAVAIAWLALKLAPEPSRGLLVGAAVAAYSLPGAAGAVTLARWLAGSLARWLAGSLAAAALGWRPSTPSCGPGRSA